MYAKHANHKCYNSACVIYFIISNASMRPRYDRMKRRRDKDTEKVWETLSRCLTRWPGRDPLAVHNIHTKNLRSLVSVFLIFAAHRVPPLPITTSAVDDWSCMIQHSATRQSRDTEIFSRDAETSSLFLNILKLQDRHDLLIN